MYLKVLGSLIVAYAIYSLAVSANSMYTGAWDIVSGVLMLIAGLLGVAAGITNKTNVAKAYFWSLVLLTGEVLFFGPLSLSPY